MERNGIVTRRVIPVSPVAVEYGIAPLGRTLKKSFQALYYWTVEHRATESVSRVRRQELARACAPSPRATLDLTLQGACARLAVFRHLVRLRDAFN